MRPWQAGGHFGLRSGEVAVDQEIFVYLVCELKDYVHGGQNLVCNAVRIFSHGHRFLLAKCDCRFLSVHGRSTAFSPCASDYIAILYCRKIGTGACLLRTRLNGICFVER